MYMLIYVNNISILNNNILINYQLSFINLQDSIGKPLKMIVYNELDFEYKEIEIIPSKNWSGK